MQWIKLMPVETESAHKDAEELQRDMIIRIGLGLVLVSGIGWTTAGAVGRFDMSLFQYLVLAFVVGCLVLLSVRRYIWVARLILLVGPTVILTLAIRDTYSPLLPAFSTLIVMANAVAHPLMGLAAALLSSVGLYMALPAEESLLIPIGLVWSTAGVQWILTHSFYTVLNWASINHERAANLLDEARDRRGELTRTLASLTEATRRLERTRHELAIARRQAESARMIKAQFAANISHELRTPLNLIIGFSEMMYRKPEVYGAARWTPALRADVREINLSARHLMGMVNDILDLARIDAERLPLKLEPTEIGDLCREAIDTVSGLSREKALPIRLEIAEALPTMLVDRARIRQVVINLLNNAIRFTDEGSITVLLAKEDEMLSVSVTDTGIGIPADELEHIFEEFGQVVSQATVGRGGAGLGLAICKQFVRLHGGQIEAQSKPGKGSTFRFRLPLPESAQALSHLSYYAPQEWSPRVPENPLGKAVFVVGQVDEAGASVVRNIQGYRALIYNGLDDLADDLEDEHPAGIVWLHSPTSEENWEPEMIWDAVGRTDLPLVRCEIPDETLAPETLGIADYLEKPIKSEDLVAAIRKVKPNARRFLIAEDAPGFSAFLDRLLHAEFAEATIRKAYTGYEALAILEEDTFDVLLLDLALPEMSGLEVLRRIRQSDQKMPEIIVVTGSSYAAEIQRLHPMRIEVLLRDGHRHIGRYLSALLDIAPPSYLQPTPLAQPIIRSPERPVF
jgi:signal transduction histidine kinase/CheY-like chemotaxis protein